MDYKELIRRLDDCGEFDGDLLDDAATAIETLLEEREKAVEVVRCGQCKYFREPFCIRRDDETHRERINMLTVDFCSYGTPPDRQQTER